MLTAPILPRPKFWLVISLRAIPFWAIPSINKDSFASIFTMPFCSPIWLLFTITEPLYKFILEPCTWIEPELIPVVSTNDFWNKLISLNFVASS